MTCAHRAERRNTYRMLVGNLKGRWHLEYTDVDVGIILRVSLKRLGGFVGTGFIWLKMENSGRIF
jgi:hypothetical protein